MVSDIHQELIKEAARSIGYAVFAFDEENNAVCQRGSDSDVSKDLQFKWNPLKNWADMIQLMEHHRLSFIIVGGECRMLKVDEHGMSDIVYTTNNTTLFGIMLSIASAAVLRSEA